MSIAALVPIENSLEGSVDVTLDTLAIDAPDVEIVGERLAEIRNCLIAAGPIELGEIETVYSHPQASAQCAGFLRSRVGRAQVVAVSSTAEAVRRVSARREPRRRRWATSSPPTLYGASVLLDAGRRPPGQPDPLCLARPRRGGRRCAGARAERRRAEDLDRLLGRRRRDGRMAGQLPGRALHARDQPDEDRVAAATDGMGHYMFFADFGGGSGEDAVEQALDGLRARCEEVRVLGSFRGA